MDIAEGINQCYSTNTVVYVTVSFVLAMFGIFFETKEFFYNFKSEMNFSIMATSYILWALQNTIIIFLLLQVCEVTREKAYDTPMIVHKILQENPVFLHHSNIFYNKMKSFSLHLLHRKKTFNFSGQGLFIFDYTFIFSVSLFEAQWCRKLILLFDFIICLPHRRSVPAHHTWLFCFSLICHSDAIRMHEKWTRFAMRFKSDQCCSTIASIFLFPLGVSNERKINNLFL